MYALVDCNNFFVSCERAFQPNLEGKAVVVLSNNDGCIVARSNESKAMGIQMGTPYFKIKNLEKAGRLVVCSSNYSLYGDLSSRVMSILSDAAPRLEIYSIDEAFMIADGIETPALIELSSSLIKKIRRWVGIPVSIGIAPSKTLGKVANHFAKKYKGYKGVCCIDSDEKIAKALALTPISDVWGVGRRLSPKLMDKGVKTALDFINRPSEWVKSQMGVGGVRTWLELQGKSVIEEEKHDKRQSICTSRSFADMITDYEEISLRVADFAGKCAEKLRKEGTVAQTVEVFLFTNRFREDLPQDFSSASIHLNVAASSAQEIVGAAMRALKIIFKPGFSYKKAGVIVYDIIDADAVVMSLFDYNPILRTRNDKISKVMDEVNSSGKNVLRLASQRPGHYADGIRRDHCSNLFTTDWNELLEVR